MRQGFGTASGSAAVPPVIALGSLSFPGGETGANLAAVSWSRGTSLELFGDVGAGNAEAGTWEAMVRLPTTGNTQPTSGTYSPGATNGNILIDFDSTGVVNGWIGGFGSNASIERRLYFGRQNATTDSNAFGGPDNGTGLWRHIALERAANGDVAGYSHGVQVFTAVGVTGGIAYPGGGSGTDLIGALCKEKGNFAGAFGCQCEVGGVRFSRGVLRYNAATYTVPTVPWTTDANTYGLYFFGEGSGDTLVDHSGRGNHGTLIGTPRPTWGAAHPWSV